MIKTLQWIYNLGWQHGYDAANEEAKEDARFREAVKKLRGDEVLK